MAEVRRVAALGAGTMGHGIAQACAQAGIPVVLQDVEERFLLQAVERVRANLKRGVERGKLSAAESAASLERVQTSVSLHDACREADLVIEAVPEDLALKRRVFAEVEALAPVRAILASNTSSLSVGAIAAAVKDPGRVVGMHFFNPPYILKLVEIVRGEKTSAATVDGAVAFARRLGKTPIVVKDSPGFASSRLGVALGLEAMRMVEEGVASPQDIDAAMELGYGHPMGPLKTSDLVGLDVRLAIAEHLHRELKEEIYRAPDILRRLVREGKLGKKSGHGFYRWEGDAPKV